MRIQFAITLVLIQFFAMIFVLQTVGLAAQKDGYHLTSSLWAKAVLDVSGSQVKLIWKLVGKDITPIGAQVVSGYFYADPNDFAYGSQYNPEVFVKVYIDRNGWANIAFNHITVDDVIVYTAHNFERIEDKTGRITLNHRLEEHQYDGVTLEENQHNDENDTQFGFIQVLDENYTIKQVLETKLGLPGQIALLPTGDIVVADPNYNRISIISNETVKVLAEEENIYGWSVTTLPDGRICYSLLNGKLILMNPDSGAKSYFSSIPNGARASALAAD